MVEAGPQFGEGATRLLAILSCLRAGNRHVVEGLNGKECVPAVPGRRALRLMLALVTDEASRRGQVSQRCAKNSCSNARSPADPSMRSSAIAQK
jgi:hypothetical protein